MIIEIKNFSKLEKYPTSFPCISTSNFACNVQKNYVRLPSTFWIWDYVLHFELQSPRSFHGAVVITSDSDTEDPSFDPGREQIF